MLNEHDKRENSMLKDGALCYVTFLTNKIKFLYYYKFENLICIL